MEAIRNMTITLKISEEEAQLIITGLNYGTMHIRDHIKTLETGSLIEKIHDLENTIRNSVYRCRPDMYMKGTHAKFKRIFDETFEGHDVFIIKEIITDGVSVGTHKNYRVGSKIYKDYNEKCPKGHYIIKVIEY